MEVSEAVLCQFCSQLFPLRDEPHTSRNHLPTVTDLLQSAHDCILCRVIRDNWSLELPGQGHENTATSVDFESIHLAFSLRDVHEFSTGVSWAILRVELNVPNEDNSYAYLDEFSITACQANCISLLLPDEPFILILEAAASIRQIWNAPETSIRTKISTMDSWLSNCLSNHDHCKSSLSYLPKRLIAIGSGEHPSPRLVRGTNICAGTRYIALSHCWGPELPIRTTKANLAAFSKEIPFTLLPKTFRDVLMIAEALDIQYVWIDALCIVQDDSLEWEVEAASMKDVYSGATLTIAASEASRGSEGCFKTQSSELGPASGSSMAHNQQFFSTPCSIDRPSYIVRIEAGDSREAVQQTILSTRGWTLQEQILSRRIVSCMRSSLHWQCMSTHETEFGTSFEEHGAGEVTRGFPILQEKQDVSFEDTWRNWMTNYSCRNFSFGKDRLSALAGIVRHYQETTAEPPILGLWEGSFPRDLLWVRTGTWSDMGHGFKNLNLPSWSWLSCPARITFDLWKLTVRSKPTREAIQDHTILLEWEVSWHGTAFTSNIRRTRLVLQGPIRDVLLEIAPDTGEAYPPFFLVKNSSVSNGLETVPLRCAGQFDHASVKPPYRYRCLLLRSRMHMDSKIINETFLMLELVSHSHHPLYKRVGIGCFRGKSPAFDWTVSDRIDLL